jgi:hypothetical protein
MLPYPILDDALGAGQDQEMNLAVDRGNHALFGVTWTVRHVFDLLVEVSAIQDRGLRPARSGASPVRKRRSATRPERTAVSTATDKIAAIASAAKR